MNPVYRSVHVHAHVIFDFDSVYNGCYDNGARLINEMRTSKYKCLEVDNPIISYIDNGSALVN